MNVDGLGRSLPLIATLMLHCGGNTASTTDTSDSQSTGTMATDDGAATDEPTAGETGGPPRAGCERYLACVAVTVPAALPDAQAGFGEGGTCWKGGLTEAELCIDACRTGLEQSHEGFPDEPACSLCAIDEECSAEAGEVCVSAECVPLCVDEKPFGCVCRADADCAADHLCVEGDCRTSLNCGDGEVGNDEVCDGAGCDPDCMGPVECNPVSNFGCPDGQVCSRYGECADAPADLPGQNEECLQGEVQCAAGFACFYNGDGYNADCPFDACCSELCNHDIPGSCFCQTDLDASPPLEYVGICA